MKSVLMLLALLRSFTGGFHGDPDQVSDPELHLDLDLEAVVHRVDPRFLSVTIDASLAAEERFMSLLRSLKLRTLTAALSPAFLRFGGTRQDFMEFDPQRTERHLNASADAPCDWPRLPRWLEERLKQDWTLQHRILLKEELQGSYRRVQFTEETVDQLHAFSSCCGLDLIFGLNALLRTPNNTWNSTNAAMLLRYCQSRGHGMSWELGNEPNSYEKKAGVRVDGRQLGLDFRRLREMMSQSKLYRHAALYGPDVGQPRQHRVDILDGFLQTGVEVINACTWHHYYVNGRETSLEDFLDPKILDSLSPTSVQVLQKVRQASPRTPVWLGETSSAFGGGASGLSDTFVAGFMWLDKLGLSAARGLGVVMRQVLIGSGSYHLLDDNLNPLPDYWLSLLYKRLVGPEVLRGQVTSELGRSQSVRVYLHCANRRSSPRGALTLLSLNLGLQPANVSLPSSLSSSPLEAFVLQSEQPGKQGLISRSVRLNGVVLKMVDDERLPDLRGALQGPTKRLELPGFSLAFFVFPEARAAACS